MLRAIAIKELRDTAWIAALGLAAPAYLVFSLTQKGGGPTVPFNSDELFPSMGFCFWPLALALALRQSAWEQIRGSYPFLLHRPLARWAFFAVKIAVGLVLLELVTLLPIIWYAVWASIPGNHPSPFEWWMTETAWCAWIALPVAYLAAFLTGLRPASWRGTRLLTLAGGSGLFLLVSFQSWPVALAATLALSATLAGLVFYIGEGSDFG